MDLYAYVTFTTADPDRIAERMRVFCDRLQCIDPMLPLRAMPLEIEVWGPVAARMRPERTVSLHLQQERLRTGTRRFSSASPPRNGSCRSTVSR